MWPSEADLVRWRSGRSAGGVDFEGAVWEMVMFLCDGIDGLGSVEASGKVDARTQSVDAVTPMADAHTQSVDANTLMADANTQSVDAHTPSVDAYTQTEWAREAGSWQEEIGHITARNGAGEVDVDGGGAAVGGGRDGESEGERVEGQAGGGAGEGQEGGAEGDLYVLKTQMAKTLDVSHFALLLLLL